MSLITAQALAATRCFEEMLGGPDQTCHHGPLRTMLSMRQIMCDFRLECPEHDRAVEWQELPALSKVLDDFSIASASADDLMRLHVLRAKHFLFLGNYANVEKECDQAMAALGTNPDPILLWYTLYFKGTAQQHNGAYAAAAEAFGRALAIASHTMDDRYRLYILYALSNLKQLQELHGEALEYYREFHRLHQSLNVKSAHLRAQRDSLFLASINPNKKAAASGWQWAFWIVVFILVATGIGLFYLTRWKSLALSGKGFSMPSPVLSEKGRKAGFFGIPLTSREALTDEEILVDETKIERLVALRNVRLLTQEDWESFEKDFSEIYPGFLIKLRYAHAEITKSEEKLACLIRIHYGTKDVARTLAISPQSVSVTRYRLRKKLGLPYGMTLEEYVMSL